MTVSLKRIKFTTFVVVIEVFFIIIMGFFGRYPSDSEYPWLLSEEEKGNDSDSSQGESEHGGGADINYSVYPNFQDVNVMIFIGFGFLMTFLKNYGFSSVGLNLLVSAVCVQWAAIVRGFIHADILGGEKFHMAPFDMTTFDFATATVLISMGAVLGKVSPIQLLVMGIIEIVLAQLNEYIGVDLLHVRDIGESMFIHMFGAYFGLAVTRVVYKEEIESSNKEGSVYHSDLFAMIGTIFLWIYWPSFNGGFADDAQQRERAYLNTFLSLCACTAVTFAVSSLVNKHGKFDMVHVQNSTLAGGVAVGASAQMPMQPFGAMIIGSVAGLISVLGYAFLTPFMAKRLKIHDTCGVHNLHGMPGVLAAIAAAVLAALSGNWSDRVRASIFPETFPENSSLANALDRSPIEQGGYQMLAAAITLGIAIGGGIFTGCILKIPIWNSPEDDNLFEDSDNWEVPEEGMPVAVSNNHYKITDSNHAESPM